MNEREGDRQTDRQILRERSREGKERGQGRGVCDPDIEAVIRQIQSELKVAFQLQEIFFFFFFFKAVCAVNKCAVLAKNLT